MWHSLDHKFDHFRQGDFRFTDLGFPYINLLGCVGGGGGVKTLPEAQRTQKLTPRLGLNMAPLALIANLATRWRHLTFSQWITFSH